MKSSFNLLQSSFGTFFSNPKRYLAIVAIPALLVFVTSYLEPSTETLDLISLLLLVITVLISTIASVLMTIALVHSIADESITLSGAYNKALQQFSKYFFYMIAYSIIVLLGFLLLIIPGIWLSVLLGFGMFYIILRQESITNALKASKRLVKGRWWNVFGKSLLIGVVMFVFYLVLGFVSYLVDTFINPEFAYALTSLLGICITPLVNIYFYQLFIDLEANPVASKVTPEAAPTV